MLNLLAVNEAAEDDIPARVFGVEQSFNSLAIWAIAVNNCRSGGDFAYRFRHGTNDLTDSLLLFD
jgi:hypothetical protein